MHPTGANSFWSEPREILDFFSAESVRQAQPRSTVLGHIFQRKIGKEPVRRPCEPRWSICTTGEDDEHPLPSSPLSSAHTTGRWPWLRRAWRRSHIALRQVVWRTTTRVGAWWPPARRQKRVQESGGLAIDRGSMTFFFMETLKFRNSPSPNFHSRKMKELFDNPIDNFSIHIRVEVRIYIIMTLLSSPRGKQWRMSAIIICPLCCTWSTVWSWYT